MRKHLTWYCRDFRGAAEMRGRMTKARSATEVARHLAAAGRRDEAIRLAEAEVERRPRDPAARLMLAQMLRSVAPQEALRHFEAVAARAPSSHVVFANRAGFARRTGDLALAEKQIARALSVRPEQGWYLALAARIATAAGRLDDARRHLAAAEQRAPRDIFVAIARAELAFVSGDPESARAAADEARAGSDAHPLQLLQDDVEALEAKRSDRALDAPGAGTERSVFMDVYARSARRHMQRYGSTQRHFAMISAKNSVHGSLNPKAQYREVLSVQEVMAARVIAEPLTLPMCSPIGDGAAALVLVSERKARQIGARGVRVRSSVLATGWDFAPGSGESAARYAAGLAYDAAQVGPQDLSVVELHDGRLMTSA